MVSIREVAARAGVSAGTVSNVLNRPELVAPATRTRVRQAIAALGFVRNESARHLRQGRGRAIGLMVMDLANPFFTDLARGVDETARAAGLAVILCNSDNDSAREAFYLDLLEQQRVRGVLISPLDDASERLQQLRQRGVLVVLLDRQARHPELCSVSVDDVRGGALAVRHLIERGHRRIAFVGGPPHLEQVRDRYQGALRAVREAGLGDDGLQRFDTVDPPFGTVSAGRGATERILAIPQRVRPTAIFCVTDVLALGVLQGLTRRRVPVPDEMAIVGYDDIDFAAAAAVPLSSVWQPRQLLGRTAAELLLEEADQPGSHHHRHVVFDPELVVRESSQ